MSLVACVLLGALACDLIYAFVKPLKPHKFCGGSARAGCAGLSGRSTGMGIDPQLKLFKCGNCGRRFNNPAGRHLAAEVAVGIQAAGATPARSASASRPWRGRAKAQDKKKKKGWG